MILVLVLISILIPNRGLLEQGDGMELECGTGQLSEVFQMPVEFANAIERLDAPQVKRTIELMGQCVQVRGVKVCFSWLLHGILIKEGCMCSMCNIN